MQRVKQQALSRLRAVARGQVKRSVQQERPPLPRRKKASPTMRLSTPRGHVEKQQRLERACAYLEAQDIPVTTAQLARLAEVQFITADRFLRRRTRPTEEPAQPLAQRLEQAYIHLQATGKRVTAYALSKQVDVHTSTAQRFLLMREGGRPQNPHARCTEQLERACASLQEEGVPLTVTLLARRAGVHYNTARTFVQERHLHCYQPTYTPARQATGRRSSPEVQAFLEQAYAQMQAEGKALSERGLAQQAGVSRQSARRFLRREEASSQEITQAKREVCHV